LTPQVPYTASAAAPYHFYADLDPAFHFDEDPDPASDISSDPDPTFHFDQFDADLESGFP
jgi:hypothetical protein